MIVASGVWGRAAEHGRTYPATAMKGKGRIMKVFLNDGRDEPLVGKCVFFLRERRDEINTNNVMVLT